MSDEIRPEDENELLAAETALRLVEGDERAEAESRMRNDPSFARSVEDWEVRLAGLAESVPPVAPPGNAKKALMDRLFPEPQTATGWGLGAWWRAATFALLFVVAGLGWLVLNISERQTGPLYTAAIASESGDFRVVAIVDKTVNEITLTRTAGAAPAGRILEVWAHGEDKPAVSVGLWPQGDTVRLSLPAEIAAVDGILTIGVSEEPQGGSTTGAPSGRVFGTVDIPNVRPVL